MRTNQKNRHRLARPRRRVRVEHLEARTLLAALTTASFESSAASSESSAASSQAIIITWNLPDDVVFGTLLGSEQLNATGNMPGTFAYDPPPGTRLDPGADQPLRVSFTPEDASIAGVMATIPINVLASPDFRTLDGSANHLGANFGAAAQPFLRQTTVAYDDGISVPRGGDPSSLANPRSISNSVNAQGDADLPSSRGLSQMVFQFGQFLDHDITRTPETTDPFTIPVPQGDPSFDPAATGTGQIPLFRSGYDPATGTAADQPRQQMNMLTSFIDGSVIYGSDNEKSYGLRARVGGKMVLRDDGLLPLNGVDTPLLPNANATGADDQTLFIAGDERSNEQIGLTAMHTLFVREHNAWAERIAAERFSGEDLFDPQIDEQIYLEARRIVGSLLQIVTYNEFLPAILGAGAIPEYQGYDPGGDARISNVFATAAFRVGHTMLPQELALVNAADGSVESRRLADAFFRPDVVTANGIDPILLGLLTHPQQEIDRYIVDGVRNFLFGPPGAGGLDLASLNIQRGRDHGLPTYNQVRVDFGLSPASSFAEITAAPDAQAALAAVYASVDDVDVWIGGISEDHIGQTSLGETFTAIWVDQFTRLRDGDRYFYLNQTWDADLLAELEATRLSDIILRNSELTSIQADAFTVPREDFGDAPDDVNAPQYATLRQHDGARHIVGPLFLGESVDFEADGQPTQSADGDGNDEDGVIGIVDLVAVGDTATTASFRIVSSGDARIDGWIDFNQDGDWEDAGEQIYSGVEVIQGSNTLGMTIPAGSLSGDTFGRFRLSSGGGLAPSGAAADGEVEDYRLSILNGDQAPDVAAAMTEGSITLSLESGKLVGRGTTSELFAIPVSNIGSLEIRGTASDDAVTIDLTSDFVFPRDGLRIFGGAGNNSLVITGDGSVLDFTNPDLRITDFSTLDLSSIDANTVMIDSATVAALSPNLHRITFAAGHGDHLIVKDRQHWRMADPTIVDGRFMLRADNAESGGEEAIEASMLHAWQNFLQDCDVNNDGGVTATDALQIINELARRAFSDEATQNLIDPLDVAVWPHVYFDQNGDDRATALDALRVINELARIAASGGSGEAIPLTIESIQRREAITLTSFEASGRQTPEPRKIVAPTDDTAKADLKTGNEIDAGEPRPVESIRAVDELLATDASWVSE